MGYNSELIDFGIMPIYPRNSEEHFELSDLAHNGNDRNEPHFCQYPLDELDIMTICLEIHLEDEKTGFDLGD
jgi:hypothetical protein